MYADIVPLKRLPRNVGPLTYSIPAHLRDIIQPGAWVRIPFRSQSCDGICWSLRHTRPPHLPKSRILSITECGGAPACTTQQRTLVERFASHTVVSLSLAAWSLFPEKPRRTRVNTTSSTPTPVPSTQTLSKLRYAFIRNLHKHPKQWKKIFLPLGRDAEMIAYCGLMANQNTGRGQTLVCVPTEVDAHRFSSTLARRFASRIILLHSSLSKQNFWNAWCRVATLPDAIIVSTRVGLGAPFLRLRTIVVCHESDPQYKQRDQNPRYHARHIIKSLQEAHGAQCSFLDAQPSLTLWSDTDVQRLPNTHPVPQQRRVVQIPQSTMSTVWFSDVLEERLRHDGNVLVFHNRVGFAHVLRCADCGWILRCSHCSMPLGTEMTHNLHCSRCQTPISYPTSCPLCRGTTLRLIGTGTERIRDHIHTQYPHRSVVRVDRIRESSLSKNCVVIATEKIIYMKERIPRFSTIVFYDLDSCVAIPDFRSQERAYQLLERLGTLVDSYGTYIIQTHATNSPLLTSFLQGTPDALYRDELSIRRSLSLPPVHLMYVLIGKAKNSDTLVSSSRRALSVLQKSEHPHVIFRGPFFSSPKYQKNINYCWFQLTILSEHKSAGTLRRIVDQLPTNWLIDPEPDTLLL